MSEPDTKVNSKQTCTIRKPVLNPTHRIMHWRKLREAEGLVRIDVYVPPSDTGLIRAHAKALRERFLRERASRSKKP